MGSHLRSAVIGVGYLGQFHAQKYKNNPHVQLIGVCDGRPEQAEKIAASLGVKAFTSAKDLIGQVDLVTIAATTTAHFELAKMFLQNGVHVNVEKPIAAQVQQAEELVNLAAQKKLKLAVGHIERFNPAIVELKKHMKKPTSVTLTRWAPFKPRGADVSVLHDLMIHDLDLMFWLCPGEIKNYMARGQKILTNELDVCEASFEISTGCMVHISVNRMAAQTIRQIQVIQKDATLVAQTGTLQIEKVEPLSAGQEPPLKITQWTVDKADALQRETDAFIEAVRNNTALAVSGEDGLIALRWVDEIGQRIQKNL
jgi:predicted dehydrogenase